MNIEYVYATKTGNWDRPNGFLPIDTEILFVIEKSYNNVLIEIVGVLKRKLLLYGRGFEKKN